MKNKLQYNKKTLNELKRNKNEKYDAMQRTAMTTKFKI